MKWCDCQVHCQLRSLTQSAFVPRLLRAAWTDVPRAKESVVAMYALVLERLRVAAQHERRAGTAGTAGTAGAVGTVGADTLEQAGPVHQAHRELLRCLTACRVRTAAGAEEALPVALWRRLLRRRVRLSGTSGPAGIASGHF